MSWLPPFSRGGAVRAASPATRSNSAPVSEPRIAESASGASASGGTLLGSVAMRAPSRVFHVESSCAEGAVPISPGWTMPVKLTPGTWREVACWPRKSQITL